jgi:hypothetical protein
VLGGTCKILLVLRHLHYIDASKFMDAGFYHVQDFTPTAAWPPRIFDNHFNGSFEESLSCYCRTDEDIRQEKVEDIRGGISFVRNDHFGLRV